MGIHDKIIIGAGAAGLMAAYSACEIRNDAMEKPDVLILDGEDDIGKKITATGNGKCNFTNTYQAEECYRSSDPAKAFRIIKSFDHMKTLELFKSFGILHTERNGYCYPYGEQARTLRDVLASKVSSMGARLELGKKVVRIDKLEDVFDISCVDGSFYRSRKLIVCTGGSAAPVFGSDGSMFSVLKSMGFNVKKPFPALCGMKSDYKFLKRIDGVRIKCRCSLYSGTAMNIIYSDRGEIVFNKKGLSGIPVMNSSRYAINELRDGTKTGFLLDFFPDMDIRELKDFMCSTVHSSVMPIGTALSALINDKLLKVAMLEIKLKYDAVPTEYDVKTIRQELGKLAEALKAFDINIIDHNGFENSQTTQGGVILKEIDEKNMESYKYPNMYFAGEVLDVDGMCGGYNLQWAWTTGYIAGRN